MTTGARRGELCAIRWSSISLELGRETIWLRTAIRRSPGGWAEGDLKTHQQRRIALDTETADVLRVHQELCRDRMKSIGIDLSDLAFAFSFEPEGLTPPTPDSVTQRYDRMVERLGIATTFHKLRHYSATELILAGVDIRTVAGRLGHGGGGTTTLKADTAWVSEADQRAVSGLVARMPPRPRTEGDADLVRAGPRRPYEEIAAALHRRILDGEMASGDELPTGRIIAEQFGVSPATAQRAVKLLETWGHVTVGRGLRATVTLHPGSPADDEPK